MRSTTRILVIFGIVFVLVAAAIAIVVWQMTSSVLDTTRSPRDPSALISSVTQLVIWTIVPIVAITVVGLVIFFVFVRRIMGADRKLIATGIPGTAVVLDVRDTGVTINHTTAVLEARLQVTIPGQAPYEATAEVKMGRMSWGGLQPGMTVPVKVDPQNPARVAIDWHAQQRGMAGARGAAFGQSSRSRGAQPGGVAGMVATPGGNFQIPGVAGAMQANTVRSADDVIAEGERGEGTIQAVSHTGATAAEMAPNAQLDAEKAGDPMVYVAMRVQPRNGAPFAAQGIYRVPKRKLSLLAIGRRVPVAFLPGQPETATIDWSRV